MVLNSRIQDDDEIVDIFFADVGLKRVSASLAKLELKIHLTATWILGQSKGFILSFPQFTARRYNAAMPILDSHSMEFISRGTEYTRRVGMRLGVLLRTGDVVCLEGDLGSGKTTFVQGVAAGWGSANSVSSPSFVLVNQYRRPDGTRLFHLDAYRLTGGKEAEDLDIDLMLENGVLIIEWADRILDVLPERASMGEFTLYRCKPAGFDLFGAWGAL